MRTLPVRQVALLLLIAGAACGTYETGAVGVAPGADAGSSAGASPLPGPVDSGPTQVADAGTSAGGPGEAASVDAGTGASGNGGSTQGTDAGASASGAGSAGSGPGAIADAGTGSGSIGDAGAGSGVSPACAGIVPDALPEPATAQVAKGSENAACWSATSDGQGFVAAEVHLPKEVSVAWTVFDPSGTRAAGGFAGSMTIAPQPSGFQTTGVFFPRDPPPEVILSYWSDRGAELARGTIGGDECGPGGAFRVPGGGSIATVICGSGPVGGLVASRFDAQGTRLSKAGFFSGAYFALRYPAFPATWSHAAAADASGNMLVVVTPGTVGGLANDDYAARWYDPYGTPLTKVFSAAKGSGEPMLRPLVDGTIALQAGGVWVARLSAGLAGAFGVPDWLASHRAFDLEIVRGGRAYALIPRSGAADRRTLELYAASGERCGATTFPVGGLSIGLDGTVVAASGDGGCTKTWWTALLK